FKGSRYACCIDHEVKAITVAKVSDPIGNVFVVRAKSRLSADLTSDFQPPGVGGNTDHEHMSGPAQSGHDSAQEADRSRANHGDGVPPAYRQIDANGVVGNATRLGRPPLLEPKQTRQAMQAAFGDFEKLSHRAIHSPAESKPLRFKIIKSAPK